MDYQAIIEEINIDVRSLIGKGKVADYIPALANVSADNFAMAIHTVDGQVFSVGEADTPFSIQSVSKSLTLTLALDYLGNKLWKRVGKEVSGNAFNSIVQLEYHQGIPRNPLINAGALVIADCIISSVDNAKNTILKFVKREAGNQAVHYDFEVVESERKHGYRNAALANFMKSYGNIDNDIYDVLSVYFHHCALSMNCKDLAKVFLFLANNGVSPVTGDTIISPNQAKKINSLLLTCGMYDAVGDFAYRVGLPAKSGVGGGIVAIVPGQMSISVWSPELDKNGNSLAGVKALELFTTKTGCSVF